MCHAEDVEGGAREGGRTAESLSRASRVEEKGRPEGQRTPGQMGAEAVRSNVFAYPTPSSSALKEGSYWGSYSLFNVTDSGFRNAADIFLSKHFGGSENFVNFHAAENITLLTNHTADVSHTALSASL